MTDRDAYIVLNRMEGIGPVKVRALTDALGSPRAVLECGEEALRSVAGVGGKLASEMVRQRARIDPGEEEDRAAQLGIRIVTQMDEEYPAALKTIYDPPLALYVRGRLLSTDRMALAVVGSRRATHYGLSVADRMAYQLAQAGFCVVSGLARGIDTEAHRGALKAGGRTVAVLGSALDCLYPKENAALADAIAESGAVISEYPLGRAADRLTFPYRNRIISGLSMGVLIVECDIKSGTLHTADAAAEQGRTVFAIPGRIDTPSAGGSNRLIKNGAKLVDNLSDIVEEFDLLIPRGVLTPQTPETAARLEVQLSDVEQSVVRRLWEGEMNADELARAAGLTGAKTAAVLIGLEMKRVIRMLPGRVVRLADDLRTRCP